MEKSEYILLLCFLLYVLALAASAWPVPHYMEEAGVRC